MSAEVAQATATVPRITLTRKEAAASLGVGITFFEERIQPELRVVRLGARVLIPVAELERWASDNARAVLEAHEGGAA